MQFTVYRNTGKNVVYPLLLDVTSDIIGQLNRRIVIPLLPDCTYRRQRSN
nr:CcdB family protein [Photorhabdus bodei]